MTWVLTVTIVMVCATSQMAVPGYDTFAQCEAAGKKQAAKADGVDVIKTFECDQQGGGPELNYTEIARKWQERKDVKPPR